MTKLLNAGRCLICTLGAVVLLTTTILGANRNAATIIQIDSETKSIIVDTGIKPKISVDNEDPHNHDTFKMGAFTAITVNGAKAEFSDLKIGMKVMVSVGTAGTAASITAFEALPKKKVKPVKGEPTKLFSKIEKDQIVSVGTDSIAVTSARGDRVRSYRVTATTRITVNGKPETLAALRRGMKVAINLGSGNDIAASIAVSD